MTPSSSSARIRPAVRGDLPAIVAFMVEAYPSLRAEAAFASRFYHWKYFDLEGRETGYPSAFVAEDEAGIAAFIGTLPFYLQRGAERTPAGWIADWRLHARARGRGIGQALLRRAADTIPALACVNGSPEAQKIYHHFGFNFWDCAKTWLHVRRPLSFEWPQRRGLRKPLAVYRALGHLLGRGRRPPRGATSKQLRLGAAAEVDELRALDTNGPHNGLRRDAGYLGWLTRCPAAATFFHLLYRAGEPVGYVFVQVDRDLLQRRRGRILDLYLTPRTRALTEEAYATVPVSLGEFGDVDYAELKGPLSVGAALAGADFRERLVNRFWLLTNAFACSPADEWMISLLDKDDAFRGNELVP